MTPVSQENSERIAEALRDVLPADGRSQVLFVSTDDPSGALLEALHDIMPNLKAICLDATHLAMVYEYATWRLV
jgi:hypothetical protein